MRPILYHDIDGVLFGIYQGHFQLRPNVKGWLAWVHERFELVWLTVWKPDDIKMLLSLLYCETFSNELPPVPLKVAQWYGLASKEDWLAHGTAGQDWVWIDDHIPTPDRLAALGLDAHRCLRVNPEGADELESLKGRLLERLAISRASGAQQVTRSAQLSA